MQNKKAFSFVEIIVTISIIALLVVVAMTYSGSQEQKAKNLRATADIKTLNNSLQTYLQENNSLPDPKGNKNYFSTGAEYRHDATYAFAVHGFVTQNLLPKKYLDYLPLDPRTNQYYAYGKTINGNSYEVAGVVSKEGDFISKVSGNYKSGEGLPYSLIREHDGPEFVEDGSKQHFPYNPEQRLLVAKISSFSGTVTITGLNNTYLINGEEQVLNHTIVKGDTISVSAGGEAYIFYSDGSQSTLGDSSKESKLVFANMEYKQDNNLLTKIQLALNSGTLWTKATKLNEDDEKSDFEVYTQDTEAAVRGTIFGVNIDNGKTKVTVKQGVVAIKNIKNIDSSNITDFSQLIENIKNNSIKKDNIAIDGTLVENENQESVIKVTDPNPPKTIEKDNNSSSVSSASSLSEPQEEEFSTNINFSVDDFKVDLDNATNKVNLVLPIKSVKKKINSVLLIKDGNYYLRKIDNTKDILSFTGSTVFENLDNKKIYKKERNALFLKEVSLGSYFTLDYIIGENSEINLFLCKYKYLGIKDNKNNGILKCTGKKAFKLSGKTLDIKELIEKDILEEYEELNIKEKIYNLGYIKFNNQEVKIDKDLYDKSYELYAYAPYNRPGNIDLYKEDGNSFNKDSGDIIRKCTVRNGNKYLALWAKGQCSFINNTTGWKDIFSFVDSVNYNIDYNTLVDFTNGSEKVSIGIDTSFFDYTNINENVKGIYIDTNVFSNFFTPIERSTDFLKYSNLDLGDNFAIEMRVLGSNLKRTSGIYYLFDDADNSNTNQIYLDLYNGNLDLGYYNSSSLHNIVMINNLSTLEDNKFYKVIAEINGDNWKLKVDSIEKSNNGIDDLNLENIMIGSNERKANQWNGIIDYVKIYKKD